MLGPLGFWEIMFILLLALLIFGPRRLPEIGRTLGRAMGELRKATSDFTSALDTEVTLDDKPAPRPGSPASRGSIPAASQSPSQSGSSQSDSSQSGSSQSGPSPAAAREGTGAEAGSAGTGAADHPGPAPAEPSHPAEAAEPSKTA